MASVSLGKRRRVSTGRAVAFSVRAARPIDKVLPNVNLIVTNAQQTQDLVTAATACTATGIRWNLNMFSPDSADVGTTYGSWAIIILRDGRTANTLSLTTGSNLYEPEQDVLAYGTWALQAKGDATGVGPANLHSEGDTKTMRKLKIGDKLTFIALGVSATEQTHVFGCIQIFCKF
jgi:hypothetical protein